MINLLIPSKFIMAAWVAFNFVKLQLSKFTFAIIDTVTKPNGGEVCILILPELLTNEFSINASPPKMTAMFEIKEHLLSSIDIFFR